jgi:ABC-2 type transport system ATP-binding protein
MTAAITTVGLTKHYKRVPALTDLTLDVPTGTIFGFLGPNGAGKTTTLKILAGLASPTAGTATVNGIPVTPQGSHRRAIGYLAQEPRFYGWMTGRETLRYVARFYPPDPAVERRIGELLERVGIADAADRPTRTYSGGMRQRLGIAETLVGSPAVIVLDEPVSALDPIGRRDILDLMRSLKGETTVFYSTHILDDVERVSDHVAILDQGRLVTTAPTRELLSSFARGRLRVVLAGPAQHAEPALRALDGVVSTRFVSRADDVYTFEVSTADGRTLDAQRAIARYAVDADLTLVSNAPEALDLESVFLRLVDHKEAAA